MNRHFWRACDREGGFTFVELLVTIIIAGIAFAAIVPLFVQAQEKNSADNARNVSLQIAQDKIEKIRQLDYDQIDVREPGQLHVRGRPIRYAVGLHAATAPPNVTPSGTRSRRCPAPLQRARSSTRRSR